MTTMLAHRRWRSTEAAERARSDRPLDVDAAPHGRSGQGAAAGGRRVRQLRDGTARGVTSNDRCAPGVDGSRTEGVDGVGRIRRQGRGRTSWLPEGTVAEVVRVTMHELPDDGSTHWTHAHHRPSASASARTPWPASGGITTSSPGRSRRFKVSNDPALRGEARRRRRALPEPARAGGRLQLRREDPGPGARPHPAVACR